MTSFPIRVCSRLAIFDERSKQLIVELKKNPRRSDQQIQKLACELMAEIAGQSNRLGEGTNSLVSAEWKIAVPGRVSVVDPFGRIGELDIGNVYEALAESVMQCHRLATSKQSPAWIAKYRDECLVSLNFYHAVQWDEIPSVADNQCVRDELKRFLNEIKRTGGPTEPQRSLCAAVLSQNARMSVANVKTEASYNGNAEAFRKLVVRINVKLVEGRFQVRLLIDDGDLVLNQANV